MKTKYFSIRKSVPAIFLAFALSCISTAVNATIFYISTTGNDVTGTGSKAAPWKTLSKAVTAVAVSGDIIHVNAGTYLETAKCQLKPGVSIEGDGITSIITATLTAQYVSIIEASSAEGTNGNQHISNIKFDGRNLATSWAVSIMGRSNVSIYNCTFINFKESAVMWAGRNDFNLLAPAVYATGNSFHDNIVTNCAFADAGYGRGAFQFGGQNGMLIYANTMTETGRPAGTQGWPIKNCNEGHTKNCKIYNNVVKVAPFPYAGNGDNNYWNFAIELFYEEGLEIYGNTIEGALDMNNQSKGGSAYSVYIHDNIIGHNTPAATWEDGIILEYETNDAVIERNTIKNCMEAITFSLRTGSTINNVRINNNLAYNIGITDGSKQGFAVRMITGDEVYSSHNFYLNNNVFIGLTGSNKPWWGIELPSGSAAINLKVCNNILENFDAACISASKGAVIDTLTIQNNIFYLNGNSNAPSYTGGTPKHNSTSNNISADPKFVSATDYHLQASSPGINTGIYVGLPYSGAAPDRGYAEAGAILPINLLELTVTDNKGKNLLQWKTASEINSDHFTIERSVNGIDFETIGTVSAAGYSSTEINYSFTDATPVAGNNYYRLVMVDKDKSNDISNVVSINTKKNQAANFANVQLSAGRNTLSLAINATQSEKALLILFDANGRVLLNSPVTLQAGLNRLDKSTGTIAKGIYYVKLATASEAVVKNVMATE